jgi:hypothetical protein
LTFYAHNHAIRRGSNKAQRRRLCV